AVEKRQVPTSRLNARVIRKVVKAHLRKEVGGPERRFRQRRSRRGCNVNIRPNVDNETENETGVTRRNFDIPLGSRVNSPGENLLASNDGVAHNHLTSRKVHLIGLRLLRGHFIRRHRLFLLWEVRFGQSWLEGKPRS